MRTSVFLLSAAASISLAACASTDDRTLASAGTGAAIGAAGGAGVSAIAGGDILTGAAIGAAVGGIAGAVWADQNNDGRVDGYYQDGRYYSGAPANYQGASNTYASPAERCRSIGGTALRTGAAGAAVGAGVGALAGGLGVLEGAAIGAAVGGLAGAVWADANNDGCADGYMREGRYYEGAPVIQPVPANYRAGERG